MGTRQTQLFDLVALGAVLRQREKKEIYTLQSVYFD
jgi:hypothetical protein